MASKKVIVQTEELINPDRITIGKGKTVRC